MLLIVSGIFYLFSGSIECYRVLGLPGLMLVKNRNLVTRSYGRQ